MSHGIVGRRRLAPVAFAAVVFAVAMIPLWAPRVDEPAANRWTLLAVACVFVFKAVLFVWMRRRMLANPKPLTVFGVALVDFFLALVLADATTAFVFGVSYAYARGDNRIAPFWLRVTDRALLLATAAYVIATGLATAYEMMRAGPRLAVHQGDEP